MSGIVGSRRLEWTSASCEGGWQRRRKHASVVFNNSIYMLGGFFCGGGIAANLNDVWRSDDGARWTRGRDELSGDGGDHRRGCLSGGDDGDDDDAAADENDVFEVDRTLVIVSMRIEVIAHAEGGTRIWMWASVRQLSPVWSSDVGACLLLTAACVCESAPWPGRDGHTAVVYNDHIYLFGGTCDAYSCFNDVWKSKDGAEWTAVTRDAPWPERWQHAAVVHAGSIFVIGGWGMVMLDDVWRMDSQEKWEKVCDNGPWSKRMFHMAVVFKGHIFIIGGFDGRSYLNDVWKSPDGRTWSMVADNGSLDWAPRRGHAAVVFEERMFVIGGDTGGGVAADVWSSADGEVWELVWADKPCIARIGHAVVVFKDAMIVWGGVDGRGEYFGDISETVEVETDLPMDQDTDDIEGDAMELAEAAAAACNRANGRAGSTAGDCASCVSREYETFSAVDDRDARIEWASARSELNETGTYVTSSDIRGLPVASMSSIILRATHLRGLRQRLQDAWRKNFDLLHEIERGLDPSAPSDTISQSEAGRPSTLNGHLTPPTEYSNGVDVKQAEAAVNSSTASPIRNGFTVKPSSEDAMDEDSPLPSPVCRRMQGDYAAFEKKLARLDDLQTGIRAAAVNKQAEPLKELVEERARDAGACLQAAQTMITSIESICQGQTARITQLDNLVRSLQQRLSTLQGSFHPTFEPSSHKLPPIHESGGSQTLGALSAVASTIRGAYSRLTSRSPSSSLLGHGVGLDRSSGSGSSSRRSAMGGDYNPARTDHILQNLEAALEEKSALARSLCAWLVRGPQETEGGGLYERKTTSSHLDGSASPQKASHDKLQVRRDTATHNPSLSLTFPVGSSLRSMSTTAKNGPLQNQTLPGTHLRHATTGGMVGSGGALASDAVMSDVVSIARKWDEVDLLHRLQNQAHVAINRELQHMPAEIDGAHKAERALVRAALEEATAELTAVQGRHTELRAIREGIGAWQARLCAWKSAEAVRDRCESIRQRTKELDEQLLELEDERIDCRSALDKRMKRQAPKEELERLQGSLDQAGRAVRELRRRRRKLMSEAASFVHTVAPELLLELPEVMDPLSACQGTDSAALPRRTLEDYDDVRPWDSSGDPGSGRHVLLRARYDDEEVVLKGYALHNDRQRRDLEREVSILCSLQHDAIIRARAVVEDLSHTRQTVPMLYLEFPFCSGGNLTQWLATQPERHRPWDLQAMARQLLCAVMYLHDRGVIHKDIKPGNLLIHADGRLLLSDFDLSRETQAPASSVSTRTFAGTAGYVAPEVQAGQAASPASDMYSVGVVLYQIHFPTSPSGGPIPGAVSLPEAIDHDLRDLITSLLDVEPHKRPTASSALLHPYFRQCYIDRLVNMGELVEQNKKLEAVRALLYRAQLELDQDHPVRLTVARSPSDANQALVLAMLDEYALRLALSELAGPLKVTFNGEAGVDQGGLLTEAYTLFFDGVVTPELGLFETAAPDAGVAGCVRGSSGSSTAFQRAKLFLPRSTAKDHASLMRLRGFGRLMVKCFFDGRRISSHFAPSLFKFICGVDVGVQDLQQFDPQAGTSVRWLLSATGVKDLGLDFEDVGITGRGPVTDQNKAEFARLKAEHVLINSRLKQLEAIREGFMEAIDGIFQNAAPLLKLLTHADWRVLLCGQDNVNAAQILAVLRFKDFPQRAMESGVPVWLKEAIQAFSQDDLRRFLMFVTGSPSLPAAAVGHTEIVVRGLMKSNALPVAHTCFGELDVPCYSEREVFSEKLKMAMYESGSFDKV